MSLIPRWFSRELENLLPKAPSGLSVSSDAEHVYVEADVPGLSPKEIDVSIDDDHVLWIKGDKKVVEEDKKKKYYRRSQTSFSYCVPLGDEVDESIEPTAQCREGVMMITFAKKEEKEKKGTKKIEVKGS